MEWLNNNWVAILLGLGVFFMMRRGGMGCGMGGGHHHHHDQSQGRQDASRPGATEAAITDPVSGQAVDPATALTSFFHGRAYYFATRENRDRFEAAPEQYARDAQNEADGHRHRGGGCC